MKSDQAMACEKALAGGALVMIVQTHAGETEQVLSILGDRVIATESDQYLGRSL